MAQDPAAAGDRHWYIVGRWEEYEGECRANQLRIIAVGVFYGLQLAQHYYFTAAEARDLRFHQAATALAAVGVLVALAVQLCLRRRIFPAALKFGSTAADLLLVTGLAVLGSGPFSPIRYAYFVVIALSALRFRLRLIWFATLGSMAGYMTLVGTADRTWFDASHVVPPIEQLLMLAGLSLTGMILGQVVRRVRSVAEHLVARQAGAAASGASA